MGLTSYIGLTVRWSRSQTSIGNWLAWYRPQQSLYCPWKYVSTRTIIIYICKLTIHPPTTVTNNSTQLLIVGFPAVFVNSHLKRGSEWPLEYLQFHCCYRCRISLWKGWEKTSIPGFYHWSIFLFSWYFSVYRGVDFDFFYRHVCFLDASNCLLRSLFNNRKYSCRPYRDWNDMYVNAIFFTYSIIKYWPFWSFVLRCLWVNFWSFFLSNS